MKIAVFAGTTEGRIFSKRLSALQIEHLVCVATEYGRYTIGSDDFATIIEGRMDEKKMYKFLSSKEIDCCVDATHPFALDVTENIKNVCNQLDIKYIRIKREDTGVTDPTITFFDTHELCKEALSSQKGKVLLTTGSKDLSCYCEDKSLRDRLYARVLPSVESIGICEQNGLYGKQIIAMQGPFSTELNESMINDLSISVVVSKQSGKSGGFFEKLYACKNTKTKLFVIGIPKEDEGVSIDGACEILGIDDVHNQESIHKSFDIKLIGIGMGQKEGVSAEALAFINKADVVFGAKRIIEPFNTDAKKYPIYMSEDIVEVLISEVRSDAKVAVLFSGDTGFYSGAKKFYATLEKYKKNDAFDASVEIIPGTSSVSYLASKLCISFDDAKIISLHGRNSESLMGKLVDLVKYNEKVFALMSGVDDVKRVYNVINDEIESDISIYAGYNLSYPDEKIKIIEKKNLRFLKEGLYVLFIKNSSKQKKSVSGYMADEEFIRDKVPMTKTGIRSLSLSKLRLNSDSILYDVGCGTGTVAIEASRLSREIEVYAIEKNPTAIKLTAKNIKKFKANNIKLIEGEAPDALLDLPAPTHVFIGGTQGKMEHVIRAIHQKNPNCRIVINSVSFETLEDMLKLKSNMSFKYFDIIQVAVTNTKEFGKYHMQQAQNPVWICEMELC